MHKAITSLLALAVPLTLAATPQRSSTPSQQSAPQSFVPSIQPATAALASDAAVLHSIRSPLDGYIDGPEMVGSGCPCYTYQAVVSGGTPPYTYHWFTGSTDDALVDYSFRDTGGLNETTMVVDVWDATDAHIRLSEIVTVCPSPQFSC